MVDQALRTKRGWSQTDLALRVEMDRNCLSLIELGRDSPRRLCLCLALDGRVAEVLGDVGRRMQVHTSGATPSDASA